jgi:hypothetical protein
MTANHVLVVPQRIDTAFRAAAILNAFPLSVSSVSSGYGDGATGAYGLCFQHRRPGLGHRAAPDGLLGARDWRRR